MHMLTYHSHVHGLVRDITASASRLLVLLSKCVTTHDGSSATTFDKLKPDILAECEVLKVATSKLLEALPENLKTSKSCDGLKRHANFIEHWIRKDKPESCLHDPVDILSDDLPGIVRAFDGWYDSKVVPYPELQKRLSRHIQADDMTSAVREGFAFWKTRVVEMFDLSDDIDGSRLATRLFDDLESATEGLSDQQRKACKNLYTSLYTLMRNPSSHGDIVLDRRLSEGGLILLVWLLTVLEEAGQNRRR